MLKAALNWSQRMKKLITLTTNNHVKLFGLILRQQTASRSSSMVISKD